MNKFKSKLSFLTLTFFFLIALASVANKDLTHSKSGGQIPPDFGNKNDTLLIIKTPGMGDYNKYVRTNFEKYYTGAYKIISRKELSTYPPEQFRYSFELIKTSDGQSYYTDSQGRSGTRTIRSTQCIMIDRSTDTKYYTVKTGNYGKLLKSFVPVLNKELKN